MQSADLWTNALNILAIQDEEARAALMSVAEIRHHSKDSAIIAQDDAEDQIYLILDGSVRVILLSESGQEIWIDTLETGAVLGEMAVLIGANRTSSIVADTDVVSASYAASDFMDLMENHSALGIALSRLLAQRVFQTTQRMFALSALSVPGRVYAELLRIAEPVATKKSRLIEPTPSITDIAMRVNTTRETVSRTVSDLERRGLLKRTTRGFELVDPDQLSRLLTQLTHSP
jgi:CRP/FNR family cyclic AMP-dependent transcriptional regulator